MLPPITYPTSGGQSIHPRRFPACYYNDAAASAATVAVAAASAIVAVAASVVVAAAAVAADAAVAAKSGFGGPRLYNNLVKREKNISMFFLSLIASMEKQTNAQVFVFPCWLSKLMKQYENQ